MLVDATLDPPESLIVRKGILLLVQHVKRVVRLSTEILQHLRYKSAANMHFLLPCVTV